jgi:hypothetical protein
VLYALLRKSSVTTFFDTVETGEGLTHILTKARWLGIVPMPRTSVVSRATADLRRWGTLIKWTTKDPVILASLHEAIVRLVQQIGPSGLAAVRNSVITTQRIAVFSDTNWRVEVEEATRNGRLLIPDEVLRHLKTFA